MGRRLRQPGTGRLVASAEPVPDAHPAAADLSSWSDRNAQTVRARLAAWDVRSTADRGARHGRPRSRRALACPMTLRPAATALASAGSARSAAPLAARARAQARPSPRARSRPLDDRACGPSVIDTGDHGLTAAGDLRATPRAAGAARRVASPRPTREPGPARARRCLLRPPLGRGAHPLVGRGGSGTHLLRPRCNLSGCAVRCHDSADIVAGRTPGMRSQARTELAEGHAAHCAGDGLARNSQPRVAHPRHAADPGRARPRRGARACAVPLVWNTGTYERLETLRLLDGVVDVYLPDTKYADAEVARRLLRHRRLPRRHARRAARDAPPGRRPRSPTSAASRSGGSWCATSCCPAGSPAAPRRCASSPGSCRRTRSSTSWASIAPPTGRGSDAELCHSVSAGEVSRRPAPCPRGRAAPGGELMMAAVVMLQGTASHAGKSVLAAALCRMLRAPRRSRGAVQGAEHVAQLVRHARRRRDRPRAGGAGARPPAWSRTST